MIDDWISQLLQFALEPSEILFDLLAQIFAIKSDGRMIADEVAASVTLDDAAARFIDAFDAEHLLGGDPAEQHDQPWVDEFDLLEKVVGGAGLDFVLLRRAILRRAALDRIDDEKVLAIDAAFNFAMISPLL